MIRFCHHLEQPETSSTMTNGRYNDTRPCNENKWNDFVAIVLWQSRSKHNDGLDRIIISLVVSHFDWLSCCLHPLCNSLSLLLKTAAVIVYNMLSGLLQGNAWRAAWRTAHSQVSAVRRIDLCVIIGCGSPAQNFYTGNDVRIRIVYVI